jgi:hypothetical protein
VLGGTPADNEKAWALANKIAERLFVKTIQPNPLPGHPSGSVVGFSLNHSRVEEDKTEKFTFTSRELQTRDLGMAIVVGNVPDSHFPSLSQPLTLSNDFSLEEQIQMQLSSANLSLI